MCWDHLATNSYTPIKPTGAKMTAVTLAGLSYEEADYVSMRK